MTIDEINKMIANYESKWGKLGHTNIMNPEKNAIHHSGINKDISQGGNKTMSRLDNELYKFRQKVAAGKEANKLAHKSYISPDELNKMNYDQLMNSHTLIHAQNPLYGQQNPNAKYYKREGQPGKYRYYYTKEEYDAAHANGNAADANREANARSAYETNKKIENYKNKQNVTNTSSNTRENNSQADFTKKFSDIARQSPEAAAKEIINDDNTKIKTFYNKIDDGFKKGIIVWKNGRFEMGENASDSDYENIKDEIESYSDQLEKFVKDVDTAAGSGKKTKDAIAKIMVDEIESMYQKAEAAKHEGDRWQKKEEPKVTVETVVVDAKKDPNFTKTVNIIKEAIKNGDIIYQNGKPVVMLDKNWKPKENGLKAQEAWQDLYKSFNDLSSKNKENGLSYEDVKGALMDAFNSELKKEDTSAAKHSALIINSNMGDEIMDEYSVFQEKVKRGKEMNRIAHSTFISPSDLNARYEKDLEKEGILVHAGNYKYYNKIDLPNGTTRYFYTKAEWDAYQDGQGQAAKKKQEDLEKQQKDTFEKNKAAEEAQKKAESDKWNTHKKIREDFHQVPGYMSYSSRFTDTMKETPEGSKEGKDYLFNVMYDAYKKYPKMKNIRTISSNQKDKPKDEEVFGFMDEIQKGIDKYTADFIKKYQLPEQEYTPLINNYFLSVANNLMKDNALDYDYISDVYYRNSDIGKKETKAQEILKQGDFRDHVFPEQLQNINVIEGLNRSTGQELVEKTEHSETYKGIDRDTDEEYQAALKSFAQTRPAQYIKEEYNNLKNRRTNDGKQQYSDEDIYNAIYKFLHRNVQQWAINQDNFNPDIFYLIPDLLKTMGINGKYTADPQDLVYKK